MNAKATNGNRTTDKNWNERKRRRNENANMNTNTNANGENGIEIFYWMCVRLMKYEGIVTVTRLQKIFHTRISTWSTHTFIWFVVWVPYAVHRTPYTVHITFQIWFFNLFFSIFSLSKILQFFAMRCHAMPCDAMPSHSKVIRYIRLLLSMCNT